MVEIRTFCAVIERAYRGDWIQTFDLRDFNSSPADFDERLVRWTRHDFEERTVVSLGGTYWMRKLI